MVLGTQTFDDELIFIRNPGNVDNEIGGSRHDGIYGNRYAGYSAISSTISILFFLRKTTIGRARYHRLLSYVPSAKAIFDQARCVSTDR